MGGIYRFEDRKVDNIIEWWLMNNDYALVQKENGIYLDCLYDETLSKYTTEKEVLDYIIEQIETKIIDNDNTSLKKELMILKKYRKDMKTPEEKAKELQDKKDKELYMLKEIFENSIIYKKHKL